MGDQLAAHDGILVPAPEMEIEAATARPASKGTMILT
jgi:hypothetical protein